MERKATHSGRRAGFFAWLGHYVTTHPWRVIAAWVVLVIGISTAASPAGLVDPASVRSNDPENFLPAKDESARAQHIAARAFPEPNGATASLVVTRTDGGRLTVADSARVSAVARRLNAAHLPNVASVRSTAADRSPNGRVQLGTVVLTKPRSDPRVPDAVTQVRERSRQMLSGSGLTPRYTGEAAVIKDNQGVEALVTTGMVVVILLLLLAIFRSPIVAGVTVGVITLASGAVMGLAALAAKAFGFKIDDNITGLLPVVIFGVGTDYVVFLVYRYRERLRKGESPREAMATSIARVGEAITSSAFAVTVSFGALLLSTLGSFRVLGPALAGTVLLMLAVGLTFIPAVIVLTGRRVFWPARAWRHERDGRVASRVGALVSQRPARMAVLTTALLAVFAVGAVSYQANYDQPQSASGSESAKALRDMERGYPVGTLHPTKVFVSRNDGGRIDPRSLSGFRQRLSQTTGVGQVLPVSMSRRGDVAQIQLLLKEDPFGSKAMDAVRDSIIPAAHRYAPPGTTALVGGDTAAYVDVSRAINQDMKIVFPVAGLLIGLILVVMLRSLVAPVYLMGSVILGFGATLGATVLAFQGLGGNPGLAFSIPIIVYLFVASMGSDYAILMISRLREEMRGGASARDAARLAVLRAGPAVASAGVILAGTFAALIASPLLSQTGFAVAIGVLLAAFVMAWVLVPSLTALLGRKAFWPGEASRTRSKPTTPARPRVGATDALPKVQQPEPAMAESR
jgi:putative drug exporter of the RND superfamily